MPCCTGNGVDACGAGLFCAKFDGRKQASCYAERSRADMAECSADVQCTSGSCNVAKGRCRSLPSQPCTADTGCAETGGDAYICIGTPKPTCRRAGDGTKGSECGRPGDPACQSGFTCSDCSDPDVGCCASHPRECIPRCANGQYICAC
jgi:hypothetical protein